MMDIFGEENLPEKYRFAVGKLIFDIKNSSKLSEIRKLFYEFSQIYTVIPALWLEWIRLEQNPRYPDANLCDLKSRRKKIKQLANTHFLCKKFHVLDKNAIETGNFERCLHFPWSNYQKFAEAKCESPNFTTDGLEKALCFPHSELKSVMEFCEKWAVRPIPSATVTQYKKCQKIYEKIANSDFDHELWLDALRETSDENFIIQSFEFRIGDFPLDAKLWKVYLKFLNEKHPLAMLDVYSRYCRIFIEDLPTRRKYWALIDLIGGFKKDVTKWWLDSINFEKHFEAFDSAFAFLKKILSSKTIHPELFLEYLFWFESIFPNRTCFKNLKEQFPMPNFKNQFLKFSRIPSAPVKQQQQLINPKIPATKIPENSLQDAISQFFENEFRQNAISLPATVIYYMLNSCSSEILANLQQTCKNFYFQKSMPLCHKLVVSDFNGTPIFNSHSLSIPSSNLNSGILTYLKITNSLIINSSIDAKIFSKLSKKVKFDIRHLDLTNQELTVEELKKLPCQKIKNLNLQNVSIKDGINDGILGIEDVIAKFPAAFSISICSDKFTPKTAEKLAGLKRSCKIEFFKICNIDESFDPNFFAEFIIKNYTNATKSIISFSPETEAAYQRNFEKIVKKSIKCWKNAG